MWKYGSGPRDQIFGVCDLCHVTVSEPFYSFDNGIEYAIQCYNCHHGIQSDDEYYDDDYNDEGSDYDTECKEEDSGKEVVEN